jgi:hypothetical protein
MIFETSDFIELFKKFITSKRCKEAFALFNPFKQEVQLNNI